MTISLDHLWWVCFSAPMTRKRISLWMRCDLLSISWCTSRTKRPTSSRVWHLLARSSLTLRRHPPSVIQLMSDSSPLVESRVHGLRHGRGFIHTWVIHRGRRWAHGEGHYDTPGGFRNDFVPAWGLMGRFVAMHVELGLQV